MNSQYGHVAQGLNIDTVLLSGEHYKDMVSQNTIINVHINSFRLHNHVSPAGRAEFSKQIRPRPVRPRPVTGNPRHAYVNHIYTVHIYCTYILYYVHSRRKHTGIFEC